MKKQALFTLCLTAASAVVMTGCATKQEAAEARAQQEATEISTIEARETATEVSTEPAPEPTIEPTEAPATEPTAEPKTEAPAPEAEAAKRPVHPKPVPYTVTAGDSISALAVRFGVRQPDILALNPALRSNPSNLRIGQKVMLPPGTDVSKKPIPRKVVQKPAAPAGSVVYTVERGDVLSGIAVRHGVTVKAIKDANGLKKDFIVVGQKLTIPEAKKTVAKEKKPAAPATPKKAETKKEEAPKAEPAPAPVTEAPKAEPEAPAEEILPPPPVEEQSGEEALAPPPAVAPTPAPAPATRDYVVQEGEDLVSVALRWGVSLPALRAANGIDEAADNKVAAGTTLKVPVAAE